MIEHSHAEMNEGQAAFDRFRKAVKTIATVPKSAVIARSVRMAKNEQTSKPVGSKASKQLSNKGSSKSQKSVAGSALTQRPSSKKK
ncbi:MAG TPA: hypothetical protein VNJ02_16325 [Vicinamibacterales bacterium]|nr:hypothetical protein [Vicinamibacterales bacterium]